VTTCALDDAGGDREAGGKVLVVTQIALDLLGLIKGVIARKRGKE
jgi:hypothetical protein